MKRIFVGIKISGDLASEIAFWQKRYRKKLNVRWISRKNLHITLIPPWYENDIAAVFDKLDGVRPGFYPIKVSFQKVTFGPNPKVPRLIWVEGEASQKIYELKSGIEKLMGVSPEKRGFKLHLTLARFKEKDFGSFSLKKLDDKVLWKMNAGSFQVFESILSPLGAEYKVLREISLR
jgi:RNA 2',3'-cyclic 3'-phosphodiesterase